MKQALVFATAAFSTLLFSISAQAAESPQYGHTAFKAGIYYPAIDKEFSNTKPFESYFGSSKFLLLEAELGIDVVAGVGRFGFSGHVGYSSKSADAKNSSGSTQNTKATDKTSLTVIPLYLAAYYNFDYLAVKGYAPLTLTIDAGVTLNPWIIDGPDGSTSEFNNKTGSGITWGYRASARLAFLLDIIDENTAALFDMSWGVNNSYIFAEYSFQQNDNFGQGKALNLSDHMVFLFGIALEF